MKNWFIINISGLEIPEGFYEFYFGTLTEQVHYLKARNSHKITFERLLHDHLAAELLREQGRNYNLLFLVSSPIKVLEGIAESEQGLTPFIQYLHQELDKLTDFLGVPPLHTLVFELCEHFDSLAVFKKSSLEHLNQIHDLDHLNKGTKYYEVGATWDASLLKLLENNVQQSNIEYLLQTHPLFYSRVPLKGKPRMNVLHQLFSFFQLIITEKIDLSNTILRKGRFQELSFSGNAIRAKIPGLVEQIAASLSQLKRSIEKKELSATLRQLAEKVADTEEQLQTIQSLHSHWELNTSALSCQTAPEQLKLWRKSFHQYQSGLSTAVEELMFFLNSPSNVMKTTTIEKTGDLAFWELEQNKLRREQTHLKRQVETFYVDPTLTLKDTATEVETHFEAIEKDLQRCPNLSLLLLVLFVSLLFYVIACSTVLTTIYDSLSFLVLTGIYTAASISLFLHYRNKSIRAIRGRVRTIKKLVLEKGKQLQQQLLKQKEHQRQVYELNNVNQNLQAIENIDEEYERLRQHISKLENKTTDISSIGQKKGAFNNYRFKELIQTPPTLLADYLEIYNKEEEELMIEMEKNKSPQEKITLLDLKINALDKVMINTTKQ